MLEIPKKYDIGQRIRHLRLVQDYTQAEFAEAVDISVNFLSEIENGKKGVSQDTLAKICMELNSSADYVLFGKNSNQVSLIETANSLTIDEIETTIKYLQSLLEMRRMALKKQ